MKSSKSKTGPQSREDKAMRGSFQSVSAGSKILAAIEEATECLRSDGLGGRPLTVRTYKVPPATERYRPGEVKRVRELLGTSQAVLAGFLGVNINTVRAWEQGKRIPQAIACRFLAEIEADPSYWRRRIERGTHTTETRSQSSR